MAKKSTVAKVEKLPESNLGHLVGGLQAAARKGGGDGVGDGAGDEGLDLASEGGNDEGTNDPENYDLGQFTGRQYVCKKIFFGLSPLGAEKMSSYKPVLHNWHWSHSQLSVLNPGIVWIGK